MVEILNEHGDIVIGAAAAVLFIGFIIANVLPGGLLNDYLQQFIESVC